MTDEAVMEIRRIRHQISEECEHDVDKVLDYYRKVEQELRESGTFHFDEVSGKATQVESSETP